MARITNITFAQVAQIADTMKAAGHRPTARALRERIGSGSMGTIHKLLQQYNGSTSEEREAAELPESIATALMDFIQTEIATACEPYQQTEQEIKEAVDAMAEENERLELTIERLEQERDDAREKQSIAGALHNSARIDLATMKTERDREAELNREYLMQIETKTRQVEILASYGPQITQAQDALAKSEERRIIAERDAAVLAAKLTAALERCNDFETRSADNLRIAETCRSEAKTANANYQACAARLEEAARTIDELKKKALPTAKVAKPKTAKPTPNKAAE